MLTHSPTRDDVLGLALHFDWGWGKGPTAKWAAPRAYCQPTCCEHPVIKCEIEYATVLLFAWRQPVRVAGGDHMPRTCRQDLNPIVFVWSCLFVGAGWRVILAVLFGVSDTHAHTRCGAPRHTFSLLLINKFPEWWIRTQCLICLLFRLFRLFWIISKALHTAWWPDFRMDFSE